MPMLDAAEIEAQLEVGGVKHIKQAQLEGSDFTKGAKVRFEGRAVTVLKGPDEVGDMTIQDLFDEDGDIAGRLSEV